MILKDSSSQLCAGQFYYTLVKNAGNVPLFKRYNFYLTLMLGPYDLANKPKQQKTVLLDTKKYDGCDLSPV